MLRTPLSVTIINAARNSIVARSQFSLVQTRSQVDLGQIFFNSRGFDREYRISQVSSRRRYRTSRASATDTIFALATPSGLSAIAIIRVSGTHALTIFHKLCPNSKSPTPRIALVKALHQPQVVDDLSRTGIIDPSALVLYFAAPKSSTTEDVLELHVHGGRAIVTSVLQAIASCSNEECPIRHAEPGEFTKRAFLSGRLNLTQAEALGTLLTAETEQQRRAAVIGARGGLVQHYDQWQRDLIEARGELEALIDFAEDQQFEETPEILIGSVSEKVKILQAVLAHHLENAARGELLRDGICLTIIGEPNVGKSSLLNALVSREAAIVSSQAGTTRDVVEVSIDIDGYLVRIADTAGLRVAGANSHGTQPSTDLDKVEIEGMRRALNRVQESDLVLLVLEVQIDSDNSCNIVANEEVLEAARQCIARGTRLIIAINKMDLVADVKNQKLLVQETEDQVTKQLMEGTKQSFTENITFVPISCISSGPNIDASARFHLVPLLSALRSTFDEMTSGTSFEPAGSAGDHSRPDSSIWQESLGATQRQQALLHECVEQLGDFLGLCQTDTGDTETFDLVLAAEKLRNAAACLSRITGHGADDVEQILGVVFEKFCVGK